MRTSLPGSSKGFTLFEMVVVLVLLALAAGLILPSFSRGLRGLELETEARNLVTRMKQVRTRAISRQSVFRIILHNPEDGPAFYAFADEYQRVLGSYPLPDETRFLVGDEQLPMIISFYPNGRSSGAVFGLQLEESRSLGVRVDPITGYGRVLRQLPEELQ